MQSLRHNFCARSRSTARSARSAGRSGISLFEVLLALGILLGSLVALGRLSNSGMNAAVQSRLQTKAVMRCESKLAEVVAAVEPLEDTSDTPFEDDEDWTWSMQIGEGPHVDVMMITVSVQYFGGNALASTGYSMTRFIRDPAVYEAAAEAAAAAEEDSL